MAVLLTHDIQELFIQLTESEQESVINMMRTFLESRDQEQIPDLKTYNREVSEAAKQMKNGEVCTHDEVVSLSKDWS